MHLASFPGFLTSMTAQSKKKSESLGMRLNAAMATATKLLWYGFVFNDPRASLDHHGGWVHVDRLG